MLQAKESRDKLATSGVDLYVGEASMVKLTDETNGIRVCRPSGCVELPAKHIIIATGSRSFQPCQLVNKVPINFVKGKVVTADSLSSLSQLPRSIVIIGGGVIAVEYATVMAQLGRASTFIILFVYLFDLYYTMTGVGVTVISPEDEILPFLEKETRKSLLRQMRRNHILFINEPIANIEIKEDTNGDETNTKEELAKLRKRQIGAVKVMVTDKKKKKPRILSTDLLVYCGGRNANSEGIGCENLGLNIGKYGRILVDGNFQTSVDGIYAIGDVIGPPGLASAAVQQGRFVAHHLFSNDSVDHLTRTIHQGKNQIKIDIEEDFDTEIDDFFQLKEYQSPAMSSLLFGSKDGTARKVSDSPLTLWTIPAVASVGFSINDALEEGYVSLDDIIESNDDLYNVFSSKGILVTGYGYFRDCARGRLTDKDGFLKIVAQVSKASNSEGQIFTTVQF